MSRNVTEREQAEIAARETTAADVRRAREKLRGPAPEPASTPAHFYVALGPGQPDRHGAGVCQRPDCGRPADDPVHLTELPHVL